MKTKLIKSHIIVLYTHEKSDNNTYHKWSPKKKNTVKGSYEKHGLMPDYAVVK